MMMKLLAFVILDVSLGLHLKSSKGMLTLQDWLTDHNGFNVVLSPAMNNQHSMFGVTDFLQERRLMQNVKGFSASSGGSLPAAFAASGKNFATFEKSFPVDGWSGFSPSEPQISTEYKKVLSDNLPKTFEELQTPLGLSLTHWEDENALKKFDLKRTKGFAVGTGDLHEALTASVVTSGPHSSCPNCTKGFWPRKLAGKYPVTDGAFGDVWGARGLAVLPQSSRILQVMPLDYPEQVQPPNPAELPYTPKEIVTLVMVQPPIASHAAIMQSMPMHELLSVKRPAYWNKLMYQRTNHGMGNAMNQPVQFREDAMGNRQALVPLDTDIKAFESFGEQVYDRIMARERDRFWALYSEGGRKAWGDLYLTWKISSKVNQMHGERLLHDLMTGDFGPRLGAPNAFRDFLRA